MNHVHEGWIAFPLFIYLKSKKLKYQDAIIYASIRSFLNTTTGDCFPSYETIAARAGVSRDFAINSIKRLRHSGMIEVFTSKKSKDKNNPNEYTFQKIDYFEQIPMSFLDNDELTYTEKAMLLCIRQFFNHGRLATIYSITTIAKLLGVSYRTVHAQLTRLEAKGYIKSDPIIKRGKVYFKNRLRLTARINWITGQVRSLSTMKRPIQKLLVS